MAKPLIGEELKEFKWHERNLGYLSMMSMGFIPAQLVVWLSVKNNPAQRKTLMVQSSVLLALMGFSLVSCSHM